MTVDAMDVVYEGVILAWGHRQGIGNCGFLQLSEPPHDTEILFFDQDCLMNQDSSFRQGDVVRFRLCGNDAKYSRLEACGFEGIAAFARILRSQKDALTQFLYSHLPPAVKILLTDPEAQKEKLKESLARCFNHLVRCNQLSNPDLLSGDITLNETIVHFSNTEPMTNDTMMFVNSLVLTEYFREHIKVGHSGRGRPWHLVAAERTVAQTATPVRYKALMGTASWAEQSGYVILENGAYAYFTYGCFPDESFLPDDGLPVACGLIKSPIGLLAYDICLLRVPVHDENEIAYKVLLSQKFYSPLIDNLDIQLQSYLESEEKPGETSIPVQPPQLVQAEAPTAEEDDAKRGSQKSADDKEATLELHKSGISYDIGTHYLVLKNSRSVEVPERYRRVLEFMLKKVDGTSFLKSRANYMEVAGCFKAGKIEQDHPKLLQDEVEAKLSGYVLKQTEDRAKKDAQEFARDFKRWLKRKSIDPKAVIRYSNKGYEFSYGWDLNRIKRGCSEVVTVNVRVDGDVDNITDSHGKRAVKSAPY